MQGPRASAALASSTGKINGHHEICAALHSSNICTSNCKCRLADEPACLAISVRVHCPTGSAAAVAHQLLDGAALAADTLQAAVLAAPQALALLDISSARMIPKVGRWRCTPLLSAHHCETACVIGMPWRYWRRRGRWRCFTSSLAAGSQGGAPCTALALACCWLCRQQDLHGLGAAGAGGD